jgi:hypothetical protein
MIDALTYSFVPRFCSWVYEASTHYLCQEKTSFPRDRGSTRLVGLTCWVSGFSPCPFVFTGGLSIDCRTLTNPFITAFPARASISVTHAFFFCSDGDVLTGVLTGLYKTGFTLGVVGIFYSAYSLVKVRIHPWQMSLFRFTENIAHTIGEAISGIVVALEFTQ